MDVLDEENTNSDTDPDVGMDQSFNPASNSFNVARASADLADFYNVLVEYDAALKAASQAFSHGMKKQPQKGYHMSIPLAGSATKQRSA